MHRYTIENMKSRIFRPNLRTSFARNVYTLLGLGILWSVGLLIGITLQAHDRTVAGIGHHGFYALSCLVLIFALAQVRNTYRAYMRMLSGHAELDQSDTIRTYDRSLPV